ncbi:transketolase [Candidatus Sumerlaeota bacterium]|nr:transketolase [Candidatus Sumerlaeota bacterium]
MSIAADFGKGLTGDQLDELCVNAIRTLAMDAVQKANSGHPGMPMGCADFGYVLWTQFLKFDPADPAWPDRDRFVLSAGHGSMLLYALLHLSGYDLSLDDLKNFRQFGSKTPGHPEFGLTPGVECTTGPLGQGISNAVGMAIAEAWLAANFNSERHKIVDHYTYVLCSDGDLQEGVAAEAVSLAGHLGLGKIIAFYDSNHISIEGNTSLAYSDNVRSRFEGYHWHVQAINGHDRRAIAEALAEARKESERPSLIIATTTIAYGSPNKANSHESHGAPLGEEEVRATKRNLGWPENETFLVPDAARGKFAEATARGKVAHEEWTKAFKSFHRAEAEKAALWKQFWQRELPKGFSQKLIDSLPKIEAGKKAATRKSAGAAQAALMKAVPNLIGGSADLAPSTNTFVKEYGAFSKTNRSGRNFHFGIREHGMGAILNGMVYHGGVRPFGATFFVFSDYMRPPIRLAALSHLNPIYVFTHDSIFVGEDGPTHEPVEHLAALRAIPNLTVIRPADAEECNLAWVAALENTHGPTALILTRQDLPNLDRAGQCAPAEGLRKGGYVLAGEGKLTLIASGSEVSLALEVRAMLKDKHGIDSRVVSMPSWDLFEKQKSSYRKKVLGSGPRVAIEAGIRLGWDRYIGPKGLFIGVEKFGASAPYKALAEQYGLTADKIVSEKILLWLRK